MNKILTIAQDIPIPNVEDTKDVKSLLTWIVGMLLIVAGFVIRHYLLQNAKRDVEKTNQILNLEKQVIHWQNKYYEEIKYGKEQGLNMVNMVSDNNNVLGTLVKSFDILNVDISDKVKPVVKSNNDIIKDIHNHIVKNN